MEPQKNTRKCYMDRETTRSRSVGTCTMHAMAHHQKIGVFYLIHDNRVVLVKNGMAAFYPSMYVDENGEDVQRVSSGKHRPLYLEVSRWESLKQLVATHLVGEAVSYERSISAGWIPNELL